MSKQTITLQTGKQLFVDTDLTKVFLYGNRYDSGTFNNSQYDPLELKVGMLLGKISATQGLALCDSDSVDGSQYPIGVCAEDITIADGDSHAVAYCVAGDVSKSKVILHAPDTMATVIDGRSIQDRIGADTVGVKLVVSDNLTEFDNS